jgi:hypothetical protein
MNDGARLMAIREEINRLEYQLSKPLGPIKKRNLEAWLEYNRSEFQEILDKKDLPSEAKVV